MPLYANLELKDKLLVDKENKRVKEIREAMNLLLNNITPEELKLNSYKEDYDKIVKKINNDTLQLSYYFNICLNELKMINNKKVKLICLLFNDLNLLNEIVYLNKQSVNVMYKKMLNKLIAPYIPEMKRTIGMCKGMFKEESSSDIFSELFKDVG